MFLRNAWYIGGTSTALDAAKMLALTPLGESAALCRKVDGAPVALENRCIHRMTPLSLGWVDGDNLRCMYPGMLFNDRGRALEIRRNAMAAKRPIATIPRCSTNIMSSRPSHR